jgi:uroporphyrin-3 C-methyltransferase
MNDKPNKPTHNSDDHNAENIYSENNLPDNNDPDNNDPDNNDPEQIEQDTHAKAQAKDHTPVLEEQKNSGEQNNTAEEANKPNATPTLNTTPVKSSERNRQKDSPTAYLHPKSLIWVVILMLTGWLATAAGAYWAFLGYQADQDKAVSIQDNYSNIGKDVASQLSQVENEQKASVNALKQNLDSQLDAIKRETSSNLNSLTKQIQQHEDRLNGQQERLSNLSTTSREDWLLAEAEYLLKLANQRVLLERTPKNVVALLSRADAIIERVSAGLGDRELFAIRQLLAEEITALKLIEEVDAQGIYLKLGALAKAIDTLPTLPTPEERFSKNKTQVNEAAGIWCQFKREMGNVFQFLNDSFSMRSADELANPIVSQQHLQLMQLNARLLIEQAQISLLKEDATSYQESLKAAGELINQYYFESTARAAYGQEIAMLANQDITSTLPDISRSLRLLHSYIATQHRLNQPSAGNINNPEEGTQ